MPCNCDVDMEQPHGVNKIHVNGCELNSQEHKNGHHPHRKVHDEEEQQDNDSGAESDFVRLLFMDY